MRYLFLLSFLFAGAVEKTIPVLAFYYPLYQTPAVSKKWGEWRIVFGEEELSLARQDPEKAKKLERFYSAKQERMRLGIFFPEEDDYAELTEDGLPAGRTVNHPLIGFYDSTDEKLIRTHLRWAKQTGIDGFLVSWWGRDSLSDQVFRKMLEISARIQGPFLTIYYEEVSQSTKEQVLQDLTYILNTYALEDKFLRRQEQPVIFLSRRVMEALNRLEWAEVGNTLKEYFTLLFGEVTDPYELPENIDGAHWSNPVEQILKLGKEKMKQEYESYVERAKGKGKLACVPVIPGHDDTRIRKEGKKVDREGGELYIRLFEYARAAHPDCILINSWNEWSKGTEIEPSVEYRDTYFRLTRIYTILAPK
ncbi:MAG: glycoside hydrolase family 99-like domain-containing protein [bacterium JZ-2024 1]